MKAKEQKRNMVIGITAVIIIIGFLFLMSQNNTGNESIVSPAVKQTANTGSVELTKNVTIQVPDTNFTVNLTSETGKTAKYGDFPNNPEAGYGTVTILPEFTARFAEKDFVSTIAVNSGGSGEFFYVAYFQPSENGYTMTSFAPLADRIKMTGLSVANSQVTVSYMDHGPDQAMVDDPNTPVVKVYTANDGILTEVIQ